jgi:heme/copper-type cytochrome/quinol oxidase subunit 3
MISVLELASIMLGLILLIMSELVVFVVLFVSYLDFYLCSSLYLFYSMPVMIVILYPYSIGLSNLLILLYSSLPL